MKKIYMLFFISLLLESCANNKIQRGNVTDEKEFGEIIFQFQSKHSELSQLNPKIIFKGSEKFEVNSEFSPIVYNIYDFILDLKLQEMNNVSIKLKPGFYYGYFELNNTEIQPFLKSRFSFQQIYFGYDPKNYNPFFNKKVEFYNENKCSNNKQNQLICPKIEIEAGKQYFVQFQLEEEKIDEKTTANLWLFTPLIPAAALGVIAPSILLGTIAYKQEINIKVNNSKASEK